MSPRKCLLQDIHGILIVYTKKARARGQRAPAWTSHQLAADGVDQVRDRFDEPCDGINNSHDHRSDFFSPLFFVRV